MRRAIIVSRRILPPVILLASLVVASSATAAISRQEAYKMGQKGRTAPQILQRAFPGVKMSRMQQAPIRVLLAEDYDSVVLQGQTPVLLTDGGNAGFAAVTLEPQHRYEIKRVGTSFVVVDLEAPATKFTLRGPVLFDSVGAPSGIWVAKPLQIDRRYRGVMRVQKGRAKLVSLVNVLDVEDYLLGTLPGDMPPAWGVRAPSTLRAGAIALRSRALTQRKLPSAPFDFTASDPRYLGIDGERTRTTQAVQRTKNLTLQRSGYPYPASFSGSLAMGSTAFKPRPGTPLPVAFGPAKPVEGAAAGKAQLALDMAIGFANQVPKIPYLWGGTTPAGFDCSGLVQYVYAQHGVKLPRVAADQARVGEPVRRIADLLPGDAVFFADSSGYIGHMGLYVGNGDMVHAPRTGKFVEIVSITKSSYYTSRFAGGRRYVPAPSGTAALHELPTLPATPAPAETPDAVPDVAVAPPA